MQAWGQWSQRENGASGGGDAVITTKLPAHKSDNLALVLDILDVHIDSRIKQKEAV